jgi:transcription-repair coupling factor (superfamily II helicase)
MAEDSYLSRGCYLRSGDVLTIWPVNSTHPIRVEIGFEKIERIESYDQDTEEKETVEVLKEMEIWPINYEKSGQTFVNAFKPDDLIIEDELEIFDEFFEEWNSSFNEVYSKHRTLSFVTFNDDEDSHQHLHYLSVLKYRGAYDLVNDIKEKYRDSWNMLIFTKDKSELAAIFKENNLVFNEDLSQFGYGIFRIFLIEVDKEQALPHSFRIRNCVYWWFRIRKFLR